MNIHDAFYRTVHEAPGGCESLAPRMGMSAAILRNKADPKKDCNKATLGDADLAMGLTGDYRLLHALAENHGHVCIQISHEAHASDLAVLELVTKVWQSNGDVGAAVHATLADGKVERHEVEHVRAAIYRTQQAMIEMLERLKGMAEK